MPQLAVSGPLDERGLHADFRAHPMRILARQAGSLGEGWRRLRDRVETRAQLQQEFRIEAGAELSREHEIIAFVIADQQRAETDARAARVGESADDELLRGLALHL